MLLPFFNKNKNLPAVGAPIFINNTFLLSPNAFSATFFGYEVIRVPKPILRPVLYPLPNSPIPYSNPSHRFHVSTCVKSTEESYLACACQVQPVPNVLIWLILRFSLHPVSLTAVESTTIDAFLHTIYSCALFETQNISTSLSLFPLPTQHL